MNKEMTNWQKKQEEWCEEIRAEFRELSGEEWDTSKYQEEVIGKRFRSLFTKAELCRDTYAKGINDELLNIINRGFKQPKYVYIKRDKGIDGEETLRMVDSRRTLTGEIDEYFNEKHLSLSRYMLNNTDKLLKMRRILLEGYSIENPTVRIGSKVMRLNKAIESGLLPKLNNFECNTAMFKWKGCIITVYKSCENIIIEPLGLYIFAKK